MLSTPSFANIVRHHRAATRLLCPTCYGNVAPFFDCRFRATPMTDKPAFDKASNTGFRHFANAIRFSYDGLREAFANESAFRQEVAVFVLMLPLGVWVARDLEHFVFLNAMSLFVIVVELLNSGIEAAIDRQGREYHAMAKLAKDYGSAAVMVALFAVGCIWLVALLQKLGVVS